MAKTYEEIFLELEEQLSLMENSNGNKIFKLVEDLKSKLEDEPAGPHTQTNLKIVREVYGQIRKMRDLDSFTPLMLLDTAVSFGSKPKLS